MARKGLTPMTDVVNRVKDILAEECAVDRAALLDDAKLEDVGISSVDMVQVMFAIEEAFGISIEQEDMSLDIETVGEVTSAIQRLVADQA